jgi:hypothetical protein
MVVQTSLKIVLVVVLGGKRPAQARFAAHEMHGNLPFHLTCNSETLDRRRGQYLCGRKRHEGAPGLFGHCDCGEIWNAAGAIHDI